MPVLLLALLGMVVVFLLLGLFGGKGGPSETAPAPTRSDALGSADHWIHRLSPDAMERLAQRLFAAMGFQVERSEVRAGGVDLVVFDPAPITGGRLFVRGVARADAGMVGEAEVQAALDLARGEGAAKALVLSPLGFSAEARLAVARTACELIDGEGLLELLRLRLPDALESAGAGFV